MSKCPGFYYEIGKKARDLLHRDYNSKQPPVHYQYPTFLDSSFKLAFQAAEIFPRFRTAVRITFPFSEEVELQYTHDYFSITAGIKRTKKNHQYQATDITRPRYGSPVIKFSNVIGSNFLSVGTALSFDTASKMISGWSTALSLRTSFLDASVALDDKGETLSASLHHTFNIVTRTAIAAEVRHTLSSQESCLAFGTQHALWPRTVIKTRVSTDGEIGALVQHEFWPKLFITISSEIETKSHSRIPKMGFSAALGHSDLQA